MNPSDITPQESREYPEPAEAWRPVPIWMLIMCLGLVTVCTAYILRSDLSVPPRHGDHASLEGIAPKTMPAQAGVDGAALFAARCAACHQAAGTGLAGVFPPLAGSNWVNGSGETLTQIVLHGIQGTLTVNGVAFNGVMPAFGTQLSDAEIAAVLTYVRSQWGNRGGPISTSQVTAQRAASAARSSAWNGDAELASAPR